MKDATGLSAVEPVTYQERFMVRIGGIMNLTDEGTVSGIVDPLPTHFSNNQSQLQGYVNDQGSYQETNKLNRDNCIPATAQHGGGPSRRMTREEYKEMRSSISTTEPSSVRMSSMASSVASSGASLNTSQFQSATSQFDGVHSMDIGTMSDV